MQLIVCLDDRDGISFAGRRQSMDRMLRRRMLETVADHRLWMNNYSARQFDALAENITVDEQYLEKAGEGDYCFAEDGAFVNYIDKISKVIIYRWGRVYPSDVTFPSQILGTMKKTGSLDFSGYSHDKITEEVYQL